MQEKLLNQLNQELKLRNYSIKTIKVYNSCLKNFLNKIKKEIENITKDNIIEFLLQLQDLKKAPKTINLYKQSIKFFWKEILKSKIILDDISFSKEAKKLPIVLTKNEIIKIINNINNLKHKFIISLTYSA
jgi:integrase/recombinase XerD